MERATQSQLSPVTFEGDPRQLAPVRLHLKLKRILDPTLAADDARSCAYLASTFRGKALEWLCRQSASNPTLFEDYSAFDELIDEVWALPESADTAQKELKLHRLKCTGSVSDFIIQFDALADDLGWSNIPRRNTLMAKLPDWLQEKLITEDDPDSYKELKDAAITRDTVHRAIHSGKTTTTGSAKKKSNRRKGKGKAAVNMIRISGRPMESPAYSYVEGIAVGPRKLKGLVDTGAAVNCIRSSLVETETFPSTIVISGATDQVLAHHPRYCVVMIDNTPQKVYLVEGLAEELILGMPYYSRTSPADVFHVNTLGTPADTGKMRPLSLPEQNAMESFVREGLKTGLLQPSLSHNPANLIYVPKKNGELRPCCDFRALNEVTVRDRHPLPLLASILDRAMGGHLFSVIDQRNAFHNLVVNPADRSKLAIKTPLGVFEFTRMPFGVTNGPSAYQRYIDRILEPYREFCMVYIDDILVFTEDDEELHLAAVAKVQWILHEHGIEIAEKKLVINQRQVKYLGHLVEHGYVTPLVRDLTIRSWPEPTNKTQLQSFLGLANYYRSFCMGFSNAAAPLYGLTGKVPWTFDEGHKMAFSHVKNAVLASVSRTRFDPELPLNCYTDASGFGIGAVMLQKEFPVAIVSRALVERERNYTTTERELLAVVYATKKWRCFFESSREPINFFTDHKSLTQQLDASAANRRINRWVEALMPFAIRLHFIQGRLNPADLPSRRHDYTAPPTNTPSDTSSDSEEGGGGDDYDWETTMGPGYWDQNGGSPQWVPGTPETLVRQLWGR